MFKYFPTNYVWNLSVNLAIEMGARIGEIEADVRAACKMPPWRPMRQARRAFRETWVKMSGSAVRVWPQEDESGAAA
jgi:hypothetical protein